jgi:hypothetical protein
MDRPQKVVAYIVRDGRLVVFTLDQGDRAG